MNPNKKKIVFIANGFGLSPILSGGEVRLFNLLKRIKKEFIPILITTAGGIIAINNFLKNINFNIINVKCSLLFKKEFFSFQRLLGYFISAFDTLYKLKKLDFDGIYTSSDAICDVLPAFFIKKQKNIKWFAMLHHKYISPFKRPGNFIKNFILYLLQNFTFSLISKKADLVFILNTKEGKIIKQSLIKRNFKGKFIKTYNGIEIKKNFLQKNFKKQKNTALFVGGVRPGKGLYDIVPIWKKVIEKNKNLKLYIAGKGSESAMKYLKKEIKKNNLEKNIFVLGYISDKKLKKLYKISFIFFLPSHEEGWGISVLEALKYRCIPVVYSLPAFDNLKNNIITIPCFDREKFSQKLLEIFSGKIKFKFNNKFVYNFSWDKIIKNDLFFIKNNL